MPPQRTVLVTGISGNLGTRLLPLLSHLRVVGVDLRPPATSVSLSRFEQMDLDREPSCRQLIDLLRETGATSVLHLAFVLDPQQTGVLDVERMWQINVAGTARVMEAISVVNRTGGAVRQFIFPSSVAAYGPETGGPVKEDAPLRAHTLPYAIHKRNVTRWCVSRRKPGRLPHLHIASAYFYRSLHAKLHGGGAARHAYGQR